MFQQPLFSVVCLFASAWGWSAAVMAWEGPVPTSTGAQHLHNVWQLSERIFSGSEPESEQALAELSALGIRTIVSVDGIAPNVAAAKKFGLRYVHIPIGYDGIVRQAELQLTRVAREIPGKIYIHCHHGKHRGPAAAAIVCRADDARSAAAARMILEKAGTGKEYPGLWRDVALFEVPLDWEQSPRLVEWAEVESLAATMARIDRTFDRLKQSAANAWQAPVDHPDVSPRHESVQLKELLAEAARASDDAAMQKHFEDNAALAGKLVEALSLSAADHTRAGEMLSRLNSNCTACHREHRNQRKR